MKCTCTGCNNEASYQTISSTNYVTQSPNYYCNLHAKDWTKKGLTIKGVIMGIKYTTISKKIK